MFGAFTFGNSEFGSVPNQDQQNQNNNNEEVIIFAPGKMEEGDNGSYF